MISQLLISSCALMAQPALADTTPDYDRIFSLHQSQKLYPCSKLPGDNYYCEKPLATLDAQGKSQGARLVRKFSVDDGEGSWFFVVDSQKSLNPKECLIQTTFENGSRSFLKVDCENIKGLPAVLQEVTSTSESSTYIFNPDLKEVGLSKDAKTTVQAQEAFALKDNPNPRIGMVEIALDPKDARDSKSKKTLNLSFPGKGQKKFTAFQLLEMKNKADLGLSENERAQALKDPFIIRVPAYRKSGERFLVELPNFMAGELDSKVQGAIGDEVTSDRFYSWLEDGGVHLRFQKEVSDKMLYYLQSFPPSASLKFKMERGADFQKNSATWTSLKIFANYVDFEATRQIDENGNEGYLARKKVFLREIFFPLFDSKGHINLWMGVIPGC